MPQPRNVSKTHHCSFCGTHKDGVPLLVSSTLKEAAVCAVCALAVIEQTFGAMFRMEALIRQAQAPGPKLVVAGDSVAQAIAAVTK